MTTPLPPVTVPTFSVIIVDDHFAVRDGLTAALETEPDIDVIATADSGASLLARYASQRPDIVLMDLQLPDAKGCSLITRLLAVDPTAKILVFSAYARDDDLKTVMSAGAFGYVQKTASRDELLAALRRVATGGRYLGSDFYQRIKGLRAGPTITLREREVLVLIAQGLSNKEIASALGIATETVKQHISTVLDKMEVKDRAHASAEAIRRGIISFGE
jgi:DNA-binding NarL/FixJ family response regulator